MQLIITSKIPFNYGKTKKIEAFNDDLASDIIRRVCILMEIQSERRMYLKLENSCEISAEDSLEDFIQ